MDLGRRVLEQQESRYTEEEDMYEEEVAQLSSLPTAFENGAWSQEDVEWIIKWKVGPAFVKPVLGYFQKTTIQSFKNISNEQFTSRVFGTRLRHSPP
jgi:hypothetical protein